MDISKAIDHLHEDFLVILTITFLSMVFRLMGINKHIIDSMVVLIGLPLYIKVVQYLIGERLSKYHAITLTALPFVAYISISFPLHFSNLPVLLIDFVIGYGLAVFTYFIFRTISDAINIQKKRLKLIYVFSTAGVVTITMLLIKHLTSTSGLELLQKLILA